MIKLRIDVDYAYPSRAKSFLFLALGITRKNGSDYLRNSRIIAKMINASSKQVMAYWFFTPYTIPDKGLLELLNPDRHEVGLHVATNPYREWKILENQTQRTVHYYTIHGTDRLLSQLLWGRKIGEKQATIPADFPLKSFHEFTTYGLDTISGKLASDAAIVMAEEWISKDIVLSIHPDWLFKQGGTSHRGPYYDNLGVILGLDNRNDSLVIKKKAFFKIANDAGEYERSVTPTGDLLEKLSSRGVDIFTFIERTWSCPIANPPSSWIKMEDNVGLLEIKDYESWWNSVGKKTRNMARKAEKSGINVSVVDADEKFIEGVWKIYNETPIRQGRAFSHYGHSLETVAWNIHRFEKNSTFIGALLQEELVGFIQIVHGDNVAVISQILSLQKHWDKAVNNALLSKAVEVCASKGERWLMYGRIGNHPSLDRFKESNGFVKYPMARYYVPLTWKGKVAIRLGLQRDFKDALPQAIKNPLIPIMNWVSRTKVRLKLRSAAKAAD